MTTITYKVGPAFFLKGPDNGVLTGTPPGLVYTPNPGFIGTDTFQYSVSSTDNPRDSEPSLVTVEVFPVADESYTGTGMVITGGVFTDQDKTGDVLLETAQFVQEWSTSLVSISGTGGENIFIGWQNTDVGELLKAPSPIQTPLVFDGLQNNTVISIDDLVLNKIDSGYDVDGPLGVGTYVLGNNFSTTWSSRIPNIAVRKDIWTDVVVFFSEPQDFNAGDRFRFVVLGRLSQSNLLDTASSTYANDLFNTGIADGSFVFSGMINDDPMTVIKGGSITFIQDGLVTIGYQGDGVDLIYPEIVIEPVEPPEPPVTLPPGIIEIVVEQTSSAAGAPGTEYTFTFQTNNPLPPNGQICMQWPFGFDIEDVNGICSETIDGTFTATKMGQTLKIFRSNNGTEIPGGTTIDITLKNMTNGKIPGGYFVEMNTADVNGVLIDGPAENANAIPITAGKPDPNTSMVDLVPDMGILANGSDTTMVVITVRDECGNLVQGVDAEISSDVPSDIITQPMFATDANGEAVGTVAATVAGAHTISVEVECPPSGPTIAINDTPMVAFASSNPVDAGSTVEASPSSITANGSDSSTITITIVDGLMNPVEGAMVTLATNGSGTIFQPGSPTNVSGQTTGTLVTTVAGVETVTATVDGSLILSDTADVTAVSGAPDDSNSMVFVSPTSGVIADGVDDTTVTVKIYDAFNNPVVGEPVALFSTGSNNTFTPQMGVTDSNGCFFSSFTTTTDEAKTITVLSDTLGFLSDTAVVTFDPSAVGVPNDGMSTVTSSPTSGIDADGVDSSLITVTVNDFAGNPVSGESVSLSASPAGGVSFSPVSGSTNGSGIFTSTMTSTSSGLKSVSANLFGSIGVLSDTASVTYDPLAGGNITGFVSIGSQPGGDTPSTFYGVGLLSSEPNTVYIHDITTDFAVPADGKIVFDFSAQVGIDLSGVSTSHSFIDGTFSTSLSGGGSILTIERQNDGTPYTGLFFMDLFGITTGSAGTSKFTLSITDNGGSPLASSVDSPNVEYSTPITVPALQYLGSYWPADQFILAGPDACATDHWHGGTVRSTTKPSGTIDQSDPAPGVCGFGGKVPTGSGVIPDLGTPDVGGLPEVNQTWPSAEKTKFDSFSPPWI
jgi:hypothetical protein